jgi:hypothetical protein
MKSQRIAMLAVFAATNLSLMALSAEPVCVVPEGTLKDARQPQAAVTAEGTIYVAFGAGHALYCSVSTDGGKSFGKPVHVGSVKALSLGARRGPRIAADGKQVVVTAIGGERGGGKDGDVLAWRSNDAGKTWAGAVRVNDAGGSAREGLHAMAGGPRGELYCVWIDLRKDAPEVFGAGSSDGGKSWSKNQLIYRSPSGSICPCCHPSVIIDGKGAIHVMWRDDIESNRDMYLATSADGGKTFSNAAKLGAGSWKLDHCPMDGGYLAALPSGKIATVWMRQKQVFRVDDKQREQRLGPGEQPWIASTSDGAYIVWLSQKNGDLQLFRPSDRQATTLARQANDPMIAAPASKQGPVITVWETGHRGRMTIMAAVVSEE